MKTKLKDLLFLQNSFPNLLNIWPPELEEFKKVKERLKSDKNKSDKELLKSDWKEIGKDFDKIIPR